MVSGSNSSLAKLFNLRRDGNFFINDNKDIKFEDLSHTGKDKALKCLMESEGYAIIHFYNSFSIYSVIKEGFRQGLRCRVVETVHSELNWSDSMMRVSAREPFVSAIAAVSNTLARKLLKSGNKNVIVLPQQVNWNKFFATSRSKKILEELNIPTERVVGFIGRLSPEKNIPVILKCAELMPNVSFVIVGDGPQKNVLEKIAKKNVYFVGQRTDVEKFYASFDVLMLPSLMEGLPLVILEAMAAGTPVVASDVGAISEVMSDRVTGKIIWNPKDANLFVSALNELFNPGLWSSCSNNCKVIAKSMKDRGDQININTLYNMLFGER